MFYSFYWIDLNLDRISPLMIYIDGYISSHKGFEIHTLTLQSMGKNEYGIKSTYIINSTEVAVFNRA